MVLNIGGKEYNNENYEFSIYINDVEINCNHIANDVHIPYKPNDIITVECKNVIFEGKGSLFWMMVYWILALVSGYGEKNPFGYPFKAIIKFKLAQSKTGRINIISNSIWTSTPFQVLDSAEILENAFYCPNHYKIRWWTGVVVPVYVLMIFIFLLFSIVNVTLHLRIILFMIPITLCGWWTVFVGKMVNKMNSL